MKITSSELYIAFQRLFGTDEAAKRDVMQFGVAEIDFDAADIDDNEYLGIDEALSNNSISELLYETGKTLEKVQHGINPKVQIGSNPFASI